MTTTTDARELGFRRAIECANASGAVAFAGMAGSGKTTALVRRAAWLAASGAAGPDGNVLLASANRRATLAFAAAGNTADGVEVRSLEDVARGVLEAARFATHLSPDLAIIPDARAARIFEEIGAALFALDWTEFVSPEIDPDITGLRSPQRFAAAAFRLIRRLRAAGIDPDGFRAAWLHGATEFYGRPPNFGNPDLKTATKAEHRDSLLVTPAELERQRLHELDLGRILSRLYESYAASLVTEGCLTETDALVEATALLGRQPRMVERLRRAYPRACLDDAQDLTMAHLALLKAWFGEALSGVTFAGDARQRTRAFSGALGEAAYRNAAETFVFDEWLRGRAAIANVALRGVDAHFAVPLEATPAGTPAVAFARARDTGDEARIVAESVTEALAAGTPAREIAIVTRSLGAAPPYLEALLGQGVVCDLAGDGSIFHYAPVQDALGALWALADPFRHDYLMRNLEAPWMRLADASIARLCAEPSQPQTLLFELPEEPSETRNRWDRRRDLRLARNVTRGDADTDLTPDARERLDRFRSVLARWETLETELDLVPLVRAIAGDTVAATFPPGARGVFGADMLARFFAYVDAYAAARPLATLHDLLSEIEALVDREESLLSIDRVRPDAVAIVDVDAAKSREWSLVLVVDVRAGAFPRYYAPEAFVFTKTLGIVAKENVGDATTARTAKFTYLMYKTKAQDTFVAEERRGFYVAASRARERLVVTASGRATQGRAAPEILEDLRRAGIAGTADLTR